MTVVSPENVYLVPATTWEGHRAHIDHMGRVATAVRYDWDTVAEVFKEYYNHEQAQTDNGHISYVIGKVYDAIYEKTLKP